MYSALGLDELLVGAAEIRRGINLPLVKDIVEDKPAVRYNRLGLLWSVSILNTLSTQTITFIAYANEHSNANPVGELHRRINGKDPIPQNHGLSKIELSGE